jgi:heme/copper-type cytochrome/quinol oxidase subunit 2
MKLWQDLLNTDVGLMSLAVIVGVLGIATVIAAFVRRKSRDDELV